MELKSDLQGLIARAWALHDGLSDEISNSKGFFCRLSSENGCYFDNAENPFQERKRLIAIRDSLKELGNMLMLLQRLRSWQLIDRNAAVIRFEESRSNLMEKLNQYQGRPIDVVREMKSCFNSGNTAFDDWNLNEKMKVEAASNVGKEKRRIINFLICWNRMFFNPWKWQKAAGVAAKLIVVSVSIASTVNFWHGRHQYCCSSQRKVLSFAETKDGQAEGAMLSISNSPLYVFYGRG